MQGISGLLWLQERNREFNGWLQDAPLEYYIDGTIDEIGEVRKSLQEKDYDELELEVGDLLWDVLSLIHKLDHEGLIDRDRVCPRCVAKFAERMPYNVEGRYEGDIAVRHELWESAKKLQKSRGVDEEHPMVKHVWKAVKEKR